MCTASVRAMKVHTGVACLQVSVCSRAMAPSSRPAKSDQLSDGAGASTRVLRQPRDMYPW